MFEFYIQRIKDEGHKIETMKEGEYIIIYIDGFKHHCFNDEEATEYLFGVWSGIIFSQHKEIMEKLKKI